MTSAKRPGRGVLPILVSLGAASLTTSEASGATPRPASLPRGVHATHGGRYLEDMCKSADIHCLGKWLLPEEWRPGMPLPAHTPEAGHTPQAGGTCGTASGLGPEDILAAYDVPTGSSAGGKIVALLELADATAFTDVTGYRASEGLKPLPQCAALPGGAGTAPCFAQVDSETGEVVAPTESVDQDADGETGLDMAMVSAVCPDCSILVVGLSEASSNLTGDNTWEGFIDAVATAKRLHASAISISFGGPENTDPNLVALGEELDGGIDFTGGYTSPGTPVFAASGDFAYLSIDLPLDAGVGGASISYPASAPDVISVGGTMLIKNSSGYDEAVWDDGTFDLTQDGQDATTSGCSTEFAMPSWQASVLAGTTCSQRANADLAAAASFTRNGSSVGIGLCAGDAFRTAEGTSASSPMVAAMFTRIGITDAISSNPGWIYANPTGFHDLGSTTYPVDLDAGTGTATDSNDPSSCGKLCTAGPGWDGPSGMGTPNATTLATLVARSASDDGGPSDGDAGRPAGGAGSSGGVFTSGGTDSGGCNVATADTDVSSLGFLGAAAGLAALTAGRRRKRA